GRGGLCGGCRGDGLGPGAARPSARRRRRRAARVEPACAALRLGDRELAAVRGFRPSPASAFFRRTGPRSERGGGPETPIDSAPRSSRGLLFNAPEQCSKIDETALQQTQSRYRRAVILDGQVLCFAPRRGDDTSLQFRLSAVNTSFTCELQRMIERKSSWRPER